MPKYAWEDFNVGDVRKFGSHTLSREEIIGFAAQWDPQPFHVDEDAAQDSIFGGLAASGWHTGSVMMRLLATHILNDSTSQGATGMEELTWLKPVRPGDTLRVEMEVMDKRRSQSRPEIGFVVNQYTVFNQEDDPVMRMRSNSIFGLRDP